MIVIAQNISLRDKEVSYSAKKSSGPGGQHVNATHSAVQLKFNASKSPAINEEVFRRLQRIAGQRMTNDGVIILQESGNRSQHRNKAILEKRLVDIITNALKPPKPRTKTKPTKASVKRRLQTKLHRSTLKKTRAAIRDKD